ncbi:MAG: enoyl-CoA hydratase [Proteobacteria bacterium]|nr:enoyl-CoA hydratase [Pseudomonadota bacterium]
MSVVLLEKHEGIATVTLNRPERLNALSSDLRTAMAQAFLDIREDPDVGVVIVTGAGRAFCSGMDLKEAAEKGLQSGGTSRLSEVLPVSRIMAECDRPIIAAVNGVAATGGFELALACDIRIASTLARFADTHARVGVLPGWGLSQKLSRLIGLGRAMEISLTGNYIDAETAQAWGLVNRVVPPEDLMPACRALARDILSSVPQAIRDYKRLILEGFQETLKQGMEMEDRVFIDYAARSSREELALRREQVFNRGREQKNR